MASRRASNSSCSEAALTPAPSVSSSWGEGLGLRLRLGLRLGLAQAQAQAQAQARAQAQAQAQAQHGVARGAERLFSHPYLSVHGTSLGVDQDAVKVIRSLPVHTRVGRANVVLVARGRVNGGHPFPLGREVEAPPY